VAGAAPAVGETTRPRGSGRPEARETATPDLSSLEDVERQHIVAALARTRGVIQGPRGAARILNIHPNTLRSRMERLGITFKHGRHEPS
jgi:formate hydrogenlyase transcriptional activator